jgi:hypothetical protein
VALWLAAIGGPILLIVADFTTLFEVRGQGISPRHIAGHVNHSYAMVVIGILALVIALAVRPRGIPAGALALVALGLAAGIVALAFDLPDATGSGGLLQTPGGFVDTTAAPRIGFYLETLGAVLVLIAGVSGLLLSAPARARRR